jgi:hypothetical protein
MGPRSFPTLGSSAGHAADAGAWLVYCSDQTNRLVPPPPRLDAAAGPCFSLLEPERLSVVLRSTRDSRAEGWLIAGAARFFRLHSKPDEA